MTTFSPLEVTPAYRTVAAEVEALILSGKIKQGERLPSEAELARRMGVNRSTVREGLRALEQAGLLRRTNGRRLVASSPQESDLTARLSQALVLQQVSFLELCETVMVLEPLAAELAADRIGPEHLARLDANLEQTRENLDNLQHVAELDVEFHLIISQAAGNKALMLAREPIGMLFYPAFLQVIARLNAGERLLFAHQAVVDALRGHRPEQAREWMHRHVVDFKRGFELANLDITSPIDAYPLPVSPGTPKPPTAQQP